MPRGGSDAANRLEEAAKLREQAVRGRRLASAVTGATDHLVLIELAEELEAEAAKLEQRYASGL